MKHHIAVKFIAVFLCALALFAAIGSAAGIICFTAADLYEQSVGDLIDENMYTTRQNLAMHLVHEYASLELGGLPEDYFYNSWGTSWMYDNFQYGYYFYDILDENGNVVESTTAEMPTGTTLYEHVVTEVSYRHLVSIIPREDEVYYEDVTIPSSTEVTIAADTGISESVPPTSETEGVATADLIPQEEIYGESYFDTELGDWVEFAYYFDELPPYTVNLYLLPGAVVVEPVWDLLTEVWQYRYELFYVLGISLLIFAVFAVYLCCAAGKKPGREEIQPSGFNCIPLDLYAAVGGIGICLIIVFGLEVAEYLIRFSPDVLAPFILFAGYGCCLIIVGFCFACAAQFKTPGGYWYKHTLVGLCIRGLIVFWNWCMDGLAGFTKSAVPVFKKVMRRLWTWTVAFFRWLVNLCLLTWNLVKKWCLIIWALVKKACIWCVSKFARFFGMLPLTWQWLLVGIILVFFLFGFPVSPVYRVMLAICIILYGSHCFGILLESTKRMGKGDLETKVSDQFLVGSFKEFAGDLNALADVAVIAAQKQMKSERMKTELITNVSHDIKTPLTSIINYVDLMQKPHTDEEQEIYLEVLSRQSQQLKKLIEDLMEMSKASTGNMVVDITAVNAAEAINQALGEFSDKLEKAQLTPVFRQPEDAIYMKADGRLAWRVMSNLLSNAVKYALPGTRLYIDLMELENKVIISMKNISREELNVSADELLERFVRGDASRNTDGSGLGLNIAQSLMEIQKGQLQLLVDGDLFKVTLVFPAVKE